MKTLILAAGYGTRLQPVIGDFPKPLVEVGGVTVLDRLVSRLEALQSHEDICIVSNARYMRHFDSWCEARGFSGTLLNDGSTEAGNRRGAIGDIAFALDTLALDDDLLIVASDNILDFPLHGLASSFEAHECAHVGVYHNPDLSDQRKRGVVVIGQDGSIESFEEKPDAPRTVWAASPIYLLPAGLLDFVPAYLEAGGNPDAPGHLMVSLCQAHPLRGWELPGRIVDIGTPETLARARELFRESPPA